jgi:hypothetical protein
MKKKEMNLKYKGYLIKKENGYCFLYDRKESNDDYPILISKDLEEVRKVVDKLSLSPVSDAINGFIN